MSAAGEPSKEAISRVLSFYGSQIASHKSMRVGFIIAFFTLIQARPSVIGVYAQLFRQLRALMIASAVVYSTSRVVL